MLNSGPNSRMTKVSEIPKWENSGFGGSESGHKPVSFLSVFFHKITVYFV